MDYGRQLLPDTFEHALSYLIDHEIDLSRFAARFNNDQTGAPAYDPAVLLVVTAIGLTRRARTTSGARLARHALAGGPIQ